MDFLDGTSTKPETIEPNQNQDGFDFMNNGEPQNNENIQNNDPFQGGSQNNENNMNTGSIQDLGNQNSQINSNMQSHPQNPQQQEVIDEAEIQRQQDRMREENERRQKIEEKINLELKLKNELREKAAEFMNDFEKKRQEAIVNRKQQNIQNQQNWENNKELAKQGKKNPWEIVSDNISLKESDYKGSKDVSRMRSVIVSRKNDVIEKNNQL